MANCHAYERGEAANTDPNNVFYKIHFRPNVIVHKPADGSRALTVG
jgi:hypothetical protein